MSEITGQERRGFRRIVHGGARRAAEKTWRFWERALGLHVLPARYDDPIPRLEGLVDDWDRAQRLLGIDLRIDEQLVRLADWAARYSDEWNFPVDPFAGAPHAFHRRNPSYGNGDAEILWAMVRESKPARMVELGSGMTTRLVAAALERNRADGSPGTLVSVDPFPGEITRRGFPGLTELVVGPAQAVSIETFSSLAPRDILLIDSSHMHKAGSDVSFIFEHVLPRLQTGVLVHLHDIYLPRPYPPVVFVEHRWFWNEQDALRLYLCENPRWEVVWSVNSLYRDHYEDFAAAMPFTTPGHAGPCSFWIRRV